MKKIISTLMVAVACLLMAAPAQAQLRWGLKAGLNLNKLSIKAKDVSGNFTTDNTTGFFVGPMAEFTLPIIGLGVDGSLLYSQRGAKEELKLDNGGKYSEKYKQHSLEIPVNLKYSFGLGDMASIYAAAGPDFIFNLKSDDFFGDVKRKNAEVGLSVGAGLKLLNHFQIGANYIFPLTKNAKEDGWSANNKTWQISLAYMF